MQLALQHVKKFPTQITQSILPILSGQRSVIVPVNRSIIKIRGQDAVPLVQGLLTNDVAKHDTLPGLFLNPKGRVICDTIITKHNDSLNIECDAALKETLFKLLRKYKLRSKVDITQGTEDRVYSVMGDATKVQQLLQHNNVQSFTDPRLPEMGLRIHGLFTNADDRLKFEEKLNMAETSLYDKYRVLLGVTEGPTDFKPDDSLPLERNYDLLKGIDFDKGCYIGQELTARTHHTGVVRKRVLPVYSDTELPASGTDFDDKGGEMLSSFGNVGLAIVRLDKIDSLTANSSKVHAIIPWWLQSSIQ